MGLGVQALCFPVRLRETVNPVNESSSEEELILPCVAGTRAKLPSPGCYRPPGVTGPQEGKVAPSHPPPRPRPITTAPHLSPGIGIHLYTPHRTAVKTGAGDRKQASAIFVSARRTEGRLYPRGHGHVGREASRNRSHSPGQTRTKVPQSSREGWGALLPGASPLGFPAATFFLL